MDSKVQMFLKLSAICLICISAAYLFSNSSLKNDELRDDRRNEQNRHHQNINHLKESSYDRCVPNKHSVCFIGKRFCHPGYTGDQCDEILVPANPWYSDGCPNLKEDITFDINMSLDMFYTKNNCSYKEMNGITGCANLCFSHPISGIPQIPLVFWKQVQQNEANVWKGMGGGSDRSEEHLEGFDNYKQLPSKNKIQ